MNELETIHNYRLEVDKECDELLRAKVHLLRLKGYKYAQIALGSKCTLATITQFAKGVHGLMARQRGDLIHYIARLEAKGRI